MDESLTQRIERLERSNRRWKVFALVLAAAMLGFSLTATFFFAQYTHALRAIDEARMQQELARQAAEDARRIMEVQMQAKKE